LIARGTHDELVRIVGELDRVALTVSALTSEEDCRRLEEAWREIAGVQSTSSDDGTVTLLVDDSNLVLPALFEAASATSVRIDKVDIQEPNLESVFLHLTGKGLRD
jgi:ABC-2 type transport system ATP-binding protein